MDNNQEFDLEDILREFGSQGGKNETDPALSFDAPAAPAPTQAEATEVSDEDTHTFAPVTESQAAEAPETSGAEDVTSEPTVVLNLPTQEESPKEEASKKAEPAFEVEEEYIHSFPYSLHPPLPAAGAEKAAGGRP